MTIKAVSLNIWGGTLLEAASAYLQRERPDIICLQEVTSASGGGRRDVLGLLRDGLPGYTVAYAPAYGQVVEGVLSQQGNAILSRFPLMSSEAVFYDVPYDENYREVPGDYAHVPRNLLHAVLSVQGQPFHALCTHGIWGRDGADTPRRLAMAAAIVAAVKGMPRTFLSGDFNMDPDTRATSMISAELPAVFAGDRAARSTFNMRRKDRPIFSELAVDMAFASPDLRVVRAEVPDIDVSDHLPLVVEIAVD